MSQWVVSGVFKEVGESASEGAVGQAGWNGGEILLMMAEFVS